MDISIKLTSITIKPPSAPSGSQEPGGAEDTDARVTYYRGDPEFDRFEHAYDDIRYRPLDERGLPKNFVGPGSVGTSTSGLNLGHEILDTFDAYYRGQTDFSAVEQKMADVVEDLKQSYEKQGFDSADFMQDLIQDVYTLARLANVRGASSASDKDGRQILKGYCKPGQYSGEWIYYDAKYYYQSEAMKTSLQDISWRLADKYGVTELDLPTSYPEGDVRKGIYENYNAAINKKMREDGHIGNFLDESFVPPEDFHLFYRLHGGNISNTPPLPAPTNDPEGLTDDSLLVVWCKDWSFMGKVPVRQNAVLYPPSVNAYDSVRHFTSNIPPDIAAVLKNIDFYAQNRGSEYESTHPRGYA